MYVYVIFPVAAPGKYLYRVPLKLESLAKAGVRAFAELQNRKCWGLVCGTAVSTDLRRVKDVINLDDSTLNLSPGFMKFILWLSEYYFAGPGEVLRAVMPKALEKYLEKKPGQGPVAEGVASAPAAVQLTADQEKARAAVSACLGAREQKPFLLHGVTGSGKTHVYFELAREAIGAGRGVLIMVPEISLTPQIVDRFKAVFGDRVAVYHSGLTDRERNLNWIAVHSGAKRLVIGVRSAVFAPVRELGLIIVDEEHDPSYSQSERSFNFNARDAAVMRGRMEGAVVVLGSATPSVESRYNAETGKYTRLVMAERFNRKPLPKVHLVDMRRERAKGNWSVFSGLLQVQLAACLEKGEQAILLKNRRGFANFIQCRECGHIPLCPHCNVSLTLHKDAGRLVCHYCEQRRPVPDKCPGCGKGELKIGGAGTERVEEELKRLFPGVRTLRLDLDTAGKRGRTGKILADFRAGAADVLIGTQMVSKGLDFERVTLVGIVLADTGLFLPDFHAPERVFQLLTQVAGRSGRGEASGEVVLQTYAPDDKTIRLAVRQDEQGFYENELKARKELFFPPFSRGAVVRFLAGDEETALKEAEKFARFLGNTAGMEVLGPAPSPMVKIRNLFRYFIYIKGTSSPVLHDMLGTAFARLEAERNAKVRIQVFFDPASLM